MSNPFRQAIPIVEERWSKGQYCNQVGEVCLVGAMAEVDYPGYIEKYTNGQYFGLFGGENSISGIELKYQNDIINVVNDLYGRVYGREFTFIAEFNDHGLTTKEIVIEVLNEAARRFDSRAEV